VLANVKTGATVGSQSLLTLPAGLVTAAKEAIRTTTIAVATVEEWLKNMGKTLHLPVATTLRCACTELEAAKRQLEGYVTNHYTAQVLAGLDRLMEHIQEALARAEERRGSTGT